MDSFALRSTFVFTKTLALARGATAAMPETQAVATMKLPNNVTKSKERKRESGGRTRVTAWFIT
jgi:hypothetical protein